MLKNVSLRTKLILNLFIPMFILSVVFVSLILITLHFSENRDIAWIKKNVTDWVTPHFGIDLIVITDMS